jgi:hypothetical protein
MHGLCIRTPATHYTHTTPSLLELYPNPVCMCMVAVMSGSAAVRTGSVGVSWRG